MMLNTLLVSLVAIATSGNPGDTNDIPNVDLWGNPLSATVSAELPGGDWRGPVPVYRVDFELLQDADGAKVRSFALRRFSEFQDLAKMLPDSHSHTLPPTPSIPALQSFLSAVSADQKALASQPMSEFLGINFNCADIHFFRDSESFAKMLAAHVPAFPPMMPNVTAGTVLQPESALECFVYLKAFHHKALEVADFNTLITHYAAQMPPFDGAHNATDVLPPGVHKPLVPPQPWLDHPVHFLPGGYNNGQNVRLSYLGKSRFNFLNETILASKVREHLGHLSPKRVVDSGTGNCFSAFVYQEQWPQAEVIGVDLSAPFIRFCRQWASSRGSPAKFYNANGEDLSFLPAGSVDLLGFSYVLHEMPSANAHAFLREAARVLAPGGTVIGFDVPRPEDPADRAALVEFNTWGHAWNSTGAHGPEPFMEEYEEGTDLPKLFGQLFRDVKTFPYDEFDEIYIGTK